MSEVRLIDANALKYKNLAEINGKLTYILTAEEINNAPTVDIKDIYQEGHYDGHLEGYTKAINEERPQGEWVDEGQYAEGHSEHAYRCKKCGYNIIELPNTISENRFCKNCGADMRKGGQA